MHPALPALVATLVGVAGVAAILLRTFPLLRIRPRPLAPGHRVEVVVAAYREDLSWLRRFESGELARYATDVRVYSKHADTAVVDGRASVILPNIGRCDHTYLHHIVTNYDRLADTTLFVTGTTRWLWWKWWCLRFGVLPRLGAANAVIAGFLRPFASADRWLALDSYRDSSGRAVSERVVPANVRPFHAWWAANFPDRPEPRYVAAEGVFAAKRTAIQNVPLVLWQSLLAQHAVGENLEVGHYMERSWYSLLSPPRTPPPR